jgi:hypothetical protein
MKIVLKTRLLGDVLLAVNKNRVAEKLNLMLDLFFVVSFHLLAKFDCDLFRLTGKRFLCTSSFLARSP